MGYNIFIINERKKEFFRTKTNGEDRNFIIQFLSDSQGETIKIEGENSALVEDILYTNKYDSYTEIDITNERT